MKKHASQDYIVSIEHFDPAHQENKHIAIVRDGQNVHSVESGWQHRYFASALTDVNFPPLNSTLPTGSSPAPVRIAEWNDLPLEMEELLVEHVMRAEGHFDEHYEISLQVAWQKKPARADHPSFLPAICSVSKHLRDIGGRVFIRNAKFTIQDKPGNEFMFEFLRSFPGDTGFRAVRELRFTSFHRYLGVHRFGSNSDLTLMSKCTGLDRVQFTFHVEPLTIILDNDDEIAANNGFERMLKPLDMIVAHYDLAKIFDCSGLRVVAFDGIYSWWIDSACSGDTKQHLQQLADWIVQGFESRKKTDLKIRVPTTEINWRTGAYRRRYDLYW
ncbi:hypothetical protein P154DRAFT_528319 [Amniculicola lignicola CBS 123094]|uniref:Uncharacterized protein n=1 Tax=Amniculicola lignicola CBS 123094 TaxID=1392246 RepID=A0A6A5VUV4_9PLEO|nr:hypothetical protein P154DRAFT_528319 [Amniculicola lignicola CBS 123094]